MKRNKYLLFMLILISSLINIGETNSPIEIINLEKVNNSKSTLNEQTDNYMIIEFDQEQHYYSTQFLVNNNQYILYIMNGNEIVYRNMKLDAKANTKIQVYFNQTLADLKGIFNGGDLTFYKHLISADLSHFDASSVTDMSLMFHRCPILKHVDLSNLNTSSVTDMSFMFQDCSSLQTLNLSNFDTSSVATMKNMFYGCSSLKYLIISNFNFDKISKTDNIEYIFKDLKKLEYIDIYNIKDSKNILKGELNELNNKTNLTVCQNNNVVITNPIAIYNCCNIIDDNLVCDIIQTTIPQILTTIPIIQTSNPMIQPSIPLIRTNINQIQTNNPMIQTNIPQI